VQGLEVGQGAWTCHAEGYAIPPEACTEAWEAINQCTLQQTTSDCEPICEQVLAAGCPEGPTQVDDCLSSCVDSMGGPCEDTSQDFLGCIQALDAGDAAWNCNEEGDVIPPDACAAEWIASGECVALYDPSNCDEACAHIMAAECTEGPPTMDICVSGCEQMGSGPCMEQTEAFFECLGPLEAEGPNAAAWSCNGEGDVIPPQACRQRVEPLEQCQELNAPSDCDEVCTHVMESGCKNTPPSLDLCLEGCWGGMDNECSDLHTEFMTCLGPLDLDDGKGDAWSCAPNGDALPPEACGDLWPPLAECLGL